MGVVTGHPIGLMRINARSHSASRTWRRCGAVHGSRYPAGSSTSTSLTVGWMWSKRLRCGDPDQSSAGFLAGLSAYCKHPHLPVRDAGISRPHGAPIPVGSLASHAVIGCYSAQGDLWRFETPDGRARSDPPAGAGPTMAIPAAKSRWRTRGWSCSPTSW